MTAFEVLEHFPDPAQDLEQLFDSRPALVIVATELFNGQDETWPYFAAEGGQHIFFYSPKAMTQIADRFGYSLDFVGGLLVFVGRSEIERLGVTASHAVATLKALSQDNMLMRRALALFVDHHRAPTNTSYEKSKRARYLQARATAIRIPTATNRWRAA